jgi:hypothetical protein
MQRTECDSGNYIVGRFAVNVMKAAQLKVRALGYYSDIHRDIDIQRG